MTTAEPQRAVGDAHPSLVGPLAAVRTRALIDILSQTETPAMTARRARRKERSGAEQDPIVWREAIGSNVVDIEGNVFVDLTSGFGVANLGHRPPSVVQAIHEQADRLLHALGDVHPADVKIELLERLSNITPIKNARVLLGSHGSDAIEAALKTAFLATKKPGVLAFVGGYHGLHQGALSVCGYSEAFRAPFAEHSATPVVFAPYPLRSAGVAASIASIDRLLDSSPSVGCILIEPMLGRGGTSLPPDGFLLALRTLARRRELLLIIDEIWTGFGRTGTRFLIEQEGLVGVDAPDLICLGKALGGGLPISACVMTEEVATAWGEPAGEALYTGTFHGSPLACAAALAALDETDAQELWLRAEQLSHEWMADLALRLRGLTEVKEIRGRGLAVGIELRSGSMTLRLVRRLLERGYITLPSGMQAETLQLAPPLTISKTLLFRFDEVLAEELNHLRSA